jgi:hypothetical protein
MDVDDPIRSFSHAGARTSSSRRDEEEDVAGSLLRDSPVPPRIYLATALTGEKPPFPGHTVAHPFVPSKGKPRETAPLSAPSVPLSGVDNESSDDDEIEEIPAPRRPITSVKPVGKIPKPAPPTRTSLFSEIPALDQDSDSESEEDGELGRSLRGRPSVRTPITSSVTTRSQAPKVSAKTSQKKGKGKQKAATAEDSTPVTTKQPPASVHLPGIDKLAEQLPSIDLDWLQSRAGYLAHPAKHAPVRFLIYTPFSFRV